MSYQYDTAFLNFKCIACDSNGINILACVSNGGLYSSNDYGNIWTLNENENVQIQNWQAVVSDFTGQYLTACVYGGGIYSSTDYGFSWVYNSDVETQLKYWQCMACTELGDIIIACEENGSIFISSDYGETWVNSYSTTKRWRSVSCNSDASIIVACEYDGYIYKSTDYGETWSISYNLINTWICIGIQPHGQTIYACAYNGGIYRMVSNNDNWVLVYNTSKKWKSIKVCDNGIVYVVIDDMNTSNPANGIYISTDSGTSWALNASSISGTKNWEFITATADGKRIMAITNNNYSNTDNGIYISGNYANDWSKYTDYFKTFSLNFTSIVSNSSGDRFAACVYGGGLYISSDAGSTWNIVPDINTLNRNWSCIATTSSGNRLVAVINDASNNNGTNGIYTSSDYGDTWTLNPNSTTQNKMWSSVASNSTGSRLVAVINDASNNNGTNGIYTSSDYGSTWIVNPNTSTTGKKWSAVASNSNGDRLVAVINDNIDNGTNGIYISFDYGATWTLNSDGSTKGKRWSSVASNSNGDRLVAIINDSIDNGTNGIYTSSDYGATWTLNSNVSTKGKQWSAVASNSTGDRLTAVINNTTNDGTNGIYTSTDYGANWTLNNFNPSGTQGKKWKSVACSASGNRQIVMGEYYYTFLSTNFGEIWFSLINSGTNPNPYIPITWYSVSFLDASNNSVFNGYFSVNNYNDLIQNFYDYNDIGNNILLGQGSVFYKFAVKNFSYDGFYISYFSYLNIYYNTGESNWYINSNDIDIQYPIGQTVSVTSPGMVNVNDYTAIFTEIPNPPSYDISTWYYVSFMDINDKTVFDGYFNINNINNTHTILSFYNTIGINVFIDNGFNNQDNLFYKIPVMNFSHGGTNIVSYEGINIPGITNATYYSIYYDSNSVPISNQVRISGLNSVGNILATSDVLTVIFTIVSGPPPFIGLSVAPPIGASANQKKWIGDIHDESLFIRKQRENAILNSKFATNPNVSDIKKLKENIMNATIETAINNTRAGGAANVPKIQSQSKVPKNIFR
jgi:hypothetical protein